MSNTESGPSLHQQFPRRPLFGAGLLIGFVVLAAAIGSWTGVGRPEPMGTPTAERTLRFEDRADGAVIVTDMAMGRQLTVMTGQNGFLRGTLRGFARTRRAYHIGESAPFQLVGYADGRLTLFDPSTGRKVELEAFGSLNEAVFVRLLTMTPGPTQAEAASPSPDQTSLPRGPGKT